MRRLVLYTVLCFVFICGEVLDGQTASSVLVFDEPGFPTADTAPLSEDLLHRAFPSAQFSSAHELAAGLNDHKTKLLILPYGSAFPEEQWAVIYQFLLRGGNLLTIGGRPFTRPVRAEENKWRLLPETYAFARRLLISDYQETPGSARAPAAINEDEPVDRLEELCWQRAYSVVIRLSQEETSSRVGTSGTVDSELKTLLWGVSQSGRRAAPVIEIDHFRNDYAGGRWVMLNCELDSAFGENPEAAAILAALAHHSERGAELLRVTPTYPLYLPDEAWQLQLQWNQYQQSTLPAKASVVVRHDGDEEIARTVDINAHSFPVNETVTLPTSGRPGFHTVEVRLQCGTDPCGVYRTAFWIRDRAYLLSGPQVTVDQNYFRLDGKRLEVVGTTYMASDAQRLYFRYPNPYVWDRDMKQISDAGLNMLRTGIWTDWDVVTGNTGTANEHTLRTIEAFLMTARQYRLPVQFTLFSFMPEVFGGVNPYLDQEAVRREKDFVISIVKPFANVPFLMWDLINEPGFDNPKRFFATRANGDAVELGIWNSWLLQRYKSRNAIEEAWHSVLPDGLITPPAESDSTAQSANDGGRPLALFDFNLFAQESFAAWAQSIRTAIRGVGSQQLITVGQDEGGALMEPSPAFFKPAVDFTTVHSWWFNDDLLWDSLAAKQKALPMLVQETGVMTETNADGRPRRSATTEAALFERKIGLALSTGAGAIEWLWNINAIMLSQQEVTIGAIRTDGTDKPEADVLRAYAQFAKDIQAHLSDPEPEVVSILTSQAEQFSVLGSVAIDAQHRAVRALSYQCHMSARMVAENQAADIAGSTLTILPSPQMLQDSTWRELISYVKDGGNILITGPADRDEHWDLRNRLEQLGITATTSTLTYKSINIQVGTEKIDASFSAAAQRALEVLTLPGGRSYLETEHGKGHIFIVSAPIELAESSDATAMVYKHVLNRLGIDPPFESANLPSSVLVRQRVFNDSVLYLFASESSSAQDLDIRDKVTETRIRLQIPAQRTELVLLSRGTGKVIVKYSSPEWPEE